jgi:hypothetical protein
MCEAYCRTLYGGFCDCVMSWPDEADVVVLCALFVPGLCSCLELETFQQPLTFSALPG